MRCPSHDGVADDADNRAPRRLRPAADPDPTLPRHAAREEPRRERVIDEGDLQSISGRLLSIGQHREAGSATP